MLRWLEISAEENETNKRPCSKGGKMKKRPPRSLPGNRPPSRKKNHSTEVTLQKKRWNGQNERDKGIMVTLKETDLEKGKCWAGDGGGGGGQKSK